MVILDFENIQRERDESQKKKTEGIFDVTSFLEKTKDKFNWTNSEEIITTLEKIDCETYTNILTRLNGVVCQIPKSQRGFLPEDGSNKIATPEYSLFDSESIVFPEVIDRQELSNYFFTKLKKTISEDKSDPTLKKRIAISIFNSIIYLHPFKDGNGRTARLSYYLLSPDISTKEKESLENIKEVLTERSKLIDKYHDQLNFIGLMIMLEKRNLPMTDRVKDAPYLYKYKMDTSDWGFDSNYLRFLAAYDVMTEEERVKYNKGTRECELVYSDNDFDENLKLKYQNNLNKIRKEFTKEIVDFSLEKDGQVSIKWLQEELLDKSFLLKNKQEN
ncbi:MAG: Fic family protein [Candidatus Pacebacteria bacterium]|nr:Fic family protein [Candidatus Paceibacterota bacterium]